MRRRDFLAAMAGALAAGTAGCFGRAGEQEQVRVRPPMCGPTYASPMDAINSPREAFAYVPVIYAGTGIRAPDKIATVDVDPQSDSYSTVVHRTPMPNIGDELHHYGWNLCSSCHGAPGRFRRFLVVPGLVSGNINILDACASERPVLYHVIEAHEIAAKTDLSWPHTVHCAPDGTIIVSMLGDADGNGPGGFLAINEDFTIDGRWERSTEGMRYNYDFWYQPRHNAMVSSEWAAPNTVQTGFRPADAEAGKYGHRLHFWDWTTRTIAQTVDLGPQGMVPLEVRFHHDPDSVHGFVGAALSSAVWHFFRRGESWHAEKVVQIEPVELEGWPYPVPGLITDILLSLDDRFLYLSNWLHGDVRQYDISDPSRPRLAGQLWLGGLIGEPVTVKGKVLRGGPQMLQLSRDGHRLYLTDSLYSVWDDQFYPGISEHGSYMLQIDCDTDRGGLSLNPRFLIDFGEEPDGPARAHEIRFPGGDCTSDIWV